MLRQPLIEGDAAGVAGEPFDSDAARFDNQLEFVNVVTEKCEVVFARRRHGDLIPGEVNDRLENRASAIQVVDRQRCSARVDIDVATGVAQGNPSTG